MTPVEEAAKSVASGEPETENSRHLNEIIEEFCTKGDPAGAEKVLRQREEAYREEAYRSQQDSKTTDSHYVLPEVSLYNLVISTYGDSGMPQEAQKLLQTMQQIPDRVSYNACLTAWAHANEPERALALLRRMMFSSSSPNRIIDARICPDTWSFNIVLSAFVHNGRERKAELVLQEMQRYAQDHPDVQPDRITLTNMIRILARQKKASAALHILMKMETSSNPDLRPDTIAYTSTIQALATAATHVHQPERHPQSARSHNYAPIRDAGGVALELLQSMEREKLRPDTIVYNSVLNVLAQAGDGERAEELLRNMQGFDHGSPSPSIVSYSTVLSAWKNTKTMAGAKRAAALLEETPNPNVVCFSTVMSAWAQQGEPEKAEALLEEFERLNALNTEREEALQSDDTGPSTRLYSTVMNAWRNSCRPDAVDQVERLLEVLESSKNRPNTICYNVLIKTIEKSSAAKKAMRAYTVLNRMASAGVRPDTRTYNAVLQACASTTHESEHPEALLIASQTFQELRENPLLKLDKYSFPAMFKCCGNLNADGKRGHDVVDQVFRWWCDDKGKMDSLILSHLQRACTNDHMEELLSERHQDIVRRKQQLGTRGSAGVNNDP